MQKGDVFSMEMTGVFNRYSAPIFRSASLGAPTSDVLRLLDTANATLELQFELAKPGVPAQVIASELKSLAKKMLNELAQPRELYAYSVGIGFPPDWVEHSMYIHERMERPLQAGMTFHSPHGFRVFDRGIGASFSETWVVTENGGERLTQAPRELVIVD
jgi:Xaa-Pro aminopeptidase